MFNKFAVELSSEPVFCRRERWDVEEVKKLLKELPQWHQDYSTLKYVNTHHDSEGWIDVDYYYAKGLTFGRVFAKFGYQRTTRETRTRCAMKFYLDDDIKNAYPT